MLKELLASLWVNTHSNRHCLLRLTESVTLSERDTVLFKNGLFVWCAILLEKASTTLDESSFLTLGGRVLKYPTSVYEDPKGVATFLELLDDLNDCVISTLSSENSGVKNQNVLTDISRVLSGRSPLLWRMVSPFFKALLREPLDGATVSYLRQQFLLLSKLEIDRGDMLQDLHSEYLAMEDILASEVSVQRAGSSRYRDFTAHVRHALREVIEAFSFDGRLCTHGPGAVSIPKVRGQVSKFRNMSMDLRIDYLLSKENTASRMGDYSPFPLLQEDRTSRVIFVPKTWKKLRGISAEPVGLQFFQQAVFRSIEKAIKSSRLSRVINLRDQRRSGLLALSSSRDGNLATIDLSSASDSVTLQLVKDIFGSSNLGRWLLATRSTHTLVGNEVLRINKFAPMGSACCFPVECLIFAGVLLATAAELHQKIHYGSFRVFGDDLICPVSIADDVMDNLRLLGFTVNADKSFVEGDFRESCGVDAWNGVDVTPLKLKDFSFDFDGSTPLSYEDHSRVVSYINSLFERGYFCTRSFLLGKLRAQFVPMRGQKIDVAKTLLFSSGAPGTVTSASPTNFHLPLVPLPGLQRYGHRMVVFRPRTRKPSHEEELLRDEVAYFTWLMKHSSDAEIPVSYDLDFFRRLNEPAVVDKDIQMIPTLGIVDTEYRLSQVRSLNNSVV